MLELLPRFLPDFLSALLINFQMALVAIMAGLLLGAPLAVARFRNGLAEAPAAGLTAVLRSVPTLVTMIFLINVVPASFSLGSWRFAMSPWAAVVTALALYAAAHSSDHALQAMRQVRNGSPIAAVLLLISLLRIFGVLVLTSGFGAAIGVAEAVTVTMRALDGLPRATDKLMLMGVVIVIFTIGFQAFYQITRRLQNRINLSYAPARRQTGQT